MSLLNDSLVNDNISAEQEHRTEQPELHMRVREVRQIIINLVINAAQAMRNGGTIRIETGFDDDNAFCRVTDTGPGVPPTLRERIFEDGFTTKPSGGSGVGLALSARLAAAHGGQLKLLDSDSGASFELLLPRPDAAYTDSAQ
jgi:two-component system NtrC family sensor kinase